MGGGQMQYDLTGRVIGCAMQVYNELGSGFLEKVYENALMIALADSGIAAKQQTALPVFFRKQEVGRYFADIFVEDKLIVELKVATTIDKSHEMQLVNYLKATGCEIGLILNFSADGLQFRKKFRTYRPPISTPASDSVDSFKDSVNPVESRPSGGAHG